MKPIKKQVKKALKRLHNKGILNMKDISTVIEEYESEFEYLRGEFGEEIAVSIYNQFAINDFVSNFVK